MTTQEFAKIAMAIKSFYQDPKFLSTEYEFNLWYRQLMDIDYSVMETAVTTWAESSRYKPTIADLRKQASQITTGNIPDWGEGWEQVMKAVRRYGLYNPEAAYEMMDDVTRRACKRVGFQEICMNENITASRAAFRDIYMDEAARQAKQNLLSPGSVERISTIRQNQIECKGD